MQAVFRALSLLRALVMYVFIVSLLPAAGIVVGSGALDFVDLLKTHSESIRPQWFDGCSLTDLPERPWPRRLCSWHLTAVGVGVTGAIVAAMACLQTGLLLFAAIWIRRDPHRLARGFASLSKLFMTVWSLTVIPRFAIFIAMAYILSWLISLHPTARVGHQLALLSFFGVPAAIVLLAQLGTMVRFWRRPEPAFNLGCAATRAEAPALYGFVENVAGRIGVKPPDWIVVTIEPEFAVIDAPVRLPDLEEPLEGGVMVLSLPLLRLLTADEVACIVAHELGHLAEPISDARSDWRTPYSALAAETDENRRVWHAPTNWHFGLLVALLDGAVTEALRQGEARADEAALRVARPQTAITAFYKAIVAQEALEIHANINFDRLQKGAVLDNLSTEAVDLTLKVLTTVDPPQLVERVRMLEMGGVGGPSIEQRIGNFGYSLDDAAALLRSNPLHGPPAPVGDLTQLEERATRNIHRFQLALAGGPGPLPPEEVDSMVAVLRG